MKNMGKSQSKQCPECGSDSIMPIIYGLIDDSEAIKKIEDREFTTGGCCVDEDSPKWQCRDCNKEFGKIDF